ncbi:MAG: Smr/MutS family protein, partial [Clostridia bacterium]
YARTLGARIAATTHYTELKSYALTTSRVENASCEFDVLTLKPTYKLLIGVPGKSNAFAISKRLGLPEHIIDSARGLIASEDKRFDEVLEKLEEKREALESELQNATRERRETAAIYKRAEEFDAAVEKDKNAALARAKAEAERLITAARKTADAVFLELDELKKKRQKSENYQLENDARVALRRSLNEAEKGLDAIRGEKKIAAAPKPPRPLRVGDIVELIAYETRGEVLEVPDKNGSLQVQAGALKVRVKLSEIRLIEESGNKTVAEFVAKKQAELRNITVKTELDIRGLMGDEAESVIENYLDTAFLAKLNTVMIIHGKGTGVLRRVVNNHLKRNNHVKDFRLGVYGEGEDGVTVVELR